MKIMTCYQARGFSGVAHMLANIIVSQMAIFMRVRSVKGHICVNFMSTFIVFNSLSSADVEFHSWTLF